MPPKGKMTIEVNGQSYHVPAGTIVKFVDKPTLERLGRQGIPGRFLATFDENASVHHHENPQND